MVFTFKCWMKNINVVNCLFLILKIYDMACQHKLKKKKIMNIKLNLFIFPKILTPLYSHSPPKVLGGVQ